MDQWLTRVGSSGPNGDIDVSIQWDNAFYRCTHAVGLTQGQYPCNLSEPIFCPGLNSDFWVSYNNPHGNQRLLVDGFYFIDESRVEWNLINYPICHETNATSGWNVIYQAYITGNCTAQGLPNYAMVSEVVVGGPVINTFIKDSVPFFLPQCIFGDKRNDTIDFISAALGLFLFISLYSIHTKLHSF